MLRDFLGLPLRLNIRLLAAEYPAPASVAMTYSSPAKCPQSPIVP